MQSTKLRDFEIWFENGEEFHRIKREVFGDHIYMVEFDEPDPLIVDVGAHIGVTVLYYKMIYPKAKLLAIEPNPENARLLRKNIEVNRLTDVDVLEVAVGVENGWIDLHVDMSGDEWYSTSSVYPGAWNNQQRTKRMSVVQKKLSQLLPGKVDLLKMDIEGAEEDVLFELNPKPSHIPHILFEFHPAFKRTPQKLEKMLERNGYALSFYQNNREIDWRKVKGLVMVEAVGK